MNDNDTDRIAARQADDRARLARNLRAAERRAHNAGIARLGRAHRCSYCAS